MGGHSIPEETIRRRYKTGLKNFFSLYKPIADYWQILDNSDVNKFSPIAIGSCFLNELSIANKNIWHKLQESYNEP